MGSYTSGRRNGRPTTDAALTLDLVKLIKDGSFQPGQNKRLLISWTEELRKKFIFCSVQMNHESGRARLIYTATSNGAEPRFFDYFIELITTPQHFGGRRWWFLCPETRERVSKLYLPPGAFTFASRKAHGLGYRSQRETDENRALNRAFALRRKLGDNWGIGEFIEKPKYMRSATFERAVVKVKKAEAIYEDHFQSYFEKSAQIRLERKKRQRRKRYASRMSNIRKCKSAENF